MFKVHRSKVSYIFITIVYIFSNKMLIYSIPLSIGKIRSIMIELFPLKYLIFKRWLSVAGLQLQLGGFGGMDYALRSTNPAPRSTNLGITKLGLSLPEFPRFLRPTIPASYVL